MASKTIAISKETEERRVPIALENLEIHEDGIFLNHHGQWIRLSAIVQDNEGNLLGTADEWSITWQCPKCGYENNAFRRTCKGCGYKPRH